jgi:antitoxin (DNA-binding transcriptional repressor) of toxin-antitoxin stability system
MRSGQHISEGDLAGDVASVLRHVEAGAEVIVERNAQAVAVIRPAEAGAPDDLGMRRSDAG